MGPDDAEEPAEPEDRPAGPRPDPFDRPWMHPSELQSYVAAPEPSAAPPRPRDWVIGVSSAVAAVVATILVLVAFGAIGSRNRAIIRPPVVTTPNEAVDYTTGQRVYTSLAPSIVTVQATITDPANPVIASGVVVRTNRVVTAAHVLNGYTALAVQTADARSVVAKLIGSDPDTDLAVLDVPGLNQPFAALASGDPTFGEPLVGVGAGKGGGGWLALGLVSQSNQMWTTPGGTTAAGLVGVQIPTTAENLGGALADISGRVVAIIATAQAGTTGGTVLAVPITVVRDVVSQVDASGKVQHGWLGVTGEDVTNRADGGARITTVVPGSPAEKGGREGGGLVVGDVVIRVGNVPIRTWGDLVAEWRRRAVGDAMPIIVLRQNDQKTVTATLTAPPAPG